MFILSALLAACTSKLTFIDVDGDGMTILDGDCWDQVEGPEGSALTGADIHPGADDAPYDGIDADCAGNDDYDLDGDGYVTDAAYIGLPTEGLEDSGAATLAGDCWDDPALTEAALNGLPQLTAAEVHPDADDTPYDGIDADCAGDDDFDADGDGYATAHYANVSGTFGEDCYDSEDDGFDGGDLLPAEINPDADEICADAVDNDCDGLLDAEDEDAEAVVWYPDADADGYGDLSAKLWEGDEQEAAEGFAVFSCEEPTGLADAYVADGTDCDDADAEQHPGAQEQCNDEDDDCDEEVDEDAEDAATFYADADGDGYGDPDSALSACTQPSDHLLDSSDCDDSSATTFPGAAPYDSSTACMADADSDDYGDDSAPAGVTDGTDCDDDDSAINPAVTEIVGDEVDQNCDGGETCYLDDDSDGYINDNLDTIESSDTDCTDTDEATSSQPTTDCDDSSATTYPGAAPSDSSTSCMKDDDGDSYGDADAPAGVTAGTDCDDDDSSINPGATEIVGDEVDQNCDGGETCYLDDDNDGYRPDSTSTVTSSDTDCTDSGEAVSTDPTTDCDDSDATSNPGETEIVGNEVDNDCSGGETCYLDNDDDGYRPDSSSTKASTDNDCIDSGEATSSEPVNDCDDSDSAINPGATEITGDSVDQNCDGGETCYTDADDDGYRPDSTSTVTSSDTDCTDSGEAVSTDPTTDCDDTDSTINPGATETVGDGVDQNCDNKETCYTDADNDGYRPDSTSTVTSSDTDCTDSGEATSSDPTSDCDDSDADINPGETEACDGVDNDCDGYIDSSDACPCDVEYSSLDPYLFCVDSLSWTDASDECASYGYHLVTIDDSTEDAWLDTTADSYSTNRWWIGFNDRSSEGSWEWEDGSSSTYTNWQSGEPNDSGGSDCGQINRYTTGTWDDTTCTTTQYYICELY